MRALGAGSESRVALVSEDNVLTFQPMLAEVVGSTLSPLDVVNPLRSFCRGANVLHGAVRTVDWACKRVQLDAGQFTEDHYIEFEHLVVALGSVVDFHQVPGMAQHGLPLKTVADALRLRSAVIHCLEEANLATDADARCRLMTIVIVGGGYTGVEAAGQLADFLKSAHRQYWNLRDVQPRVVLVHSRAHLLAEIGEKLGDYAQRVLERRGVEVVLNERVVEVLAEVAMREGLRCFAVLPANSSARKRAKKWGSERRPRRNDALRLVERGSFLTIPRAFPLREPASRAASPPAQPRQPQRARQTPRLARVHPAPPIARSSPRREAQRWQ